MMGIDLLFFVAVSSLLLHEMDAIDKKEWRLLFVLHRLPDDVAMRWFIVLHLPLFVALMALIGAAESGTVRWIEVGVDAFLIVHAGLHQRLAFRWEAAFANLLSRVLIWSAAGFGALHMVFVLVTRS